MAVEVSTRNYAFASAEEIHLVLLHRKDMLDAGADLGLCTIELLAAWRIITGLRCYRRLLGAGI